MNIDRQDFSPLIGQVYHTCMLPPEQMKEISNLKDTRERTVIGVQFCEKARVVKFLMGHHATITVPCEMFPPKDKTGKY